MHDAAIEDETEGETERDATAVAMSGALRAQLRTRTQADLVRESLVRCPGVGGEPVPH